MLIEMYILYYVVSDSNMASYNENLTAPRQLSLMVYELLDELGLSEKREGIT